MNYFVHLNPKNLNDVNWNPPTRCKIWIYYLTGIMLLLLFVILLIVLFALLFKNNRFASISATGLLVTLSVLTLYLLCKYGVVFIDYVGNLGEKWIEFTRSKRKDFVIKVEGKENFEDPEWNENDKEEKEADDQDDDDDQDETNPFLGRG